MTKPCRKHHPGAAAPSAAPRPIVPAEPVMRRWPHPVEPPTSPPGEDLGCILRRQTELLLEIRTLLIRLGAEQERKQ